MTRKTLFGIIKKPVEKRKVKDKKRYKPPLPPVGIMNLKNAASKWKPPVAVGGANVSDMIKHLEIDNPEQLKEVRRLKDLLCLHNEL